MSSYYDLLGVKEDADAEEIKRAYRAAALQNHPDRNAGDSAAEERFRAVAEAYEVLGDPRKRRAYDSLHEGSPPLDGEPRPRWRPSGGDDHFDEWLRRWMKENGLGSEGREHMRRQQEWAARTAAWRSQEEAWQEELREAEAQKQRDHRMRQRVADRRAARQAAELRRFWQTHHGVTWQDGAFLACISLLSAGSLWLLWPQRPAEQRPQAAETDRPD